MHVLSKDALAMSNKGTNPFCWRLSFLDQLLVGISGSNESKPIVRLELNPFLANNNDDKIGLMAADI